MNNQTDIKIIPYSNPVIFTLVPLFIIFLFFLTYIIIYQKLSSNPNLKNNLKIVSYFFIQFLFMPILMVFLIINLFLILISLIFLEELHYISIKTIFLFFSNLSCKGKKSEINTITVIKIKSCELPERANKYKDVSDESNQAEKINLNDNDPKFNRKINTNNHLPNSIKKPKDKGEILDFLSKALISENNIPSYISLIKMIKNKAKDKINANKENNINIKDKSNLNDEKSIVVDNSNHNIKD